MADSGKNKSGGGQQGSSRGRSDQQNRPGQQGGQQQRGKGGEQTHTDENRNVGGSGSMDSMNQDAIDTSS
jgi:hypothetical protein